MNKTKKGVSLITVLLFMLVATIAGTATYKWLSSEGLTSASRMKIVEARQAAIAGLDAARSWMSYNASDVGGVIKQYLDKKRTEDDPVIKLNNVLQGVAGNRQKYDVYLAGVSKNNANYRIKLVSVGQSQSGTKYSEAAILDINGLYQVSIPTLNSKSGSADFKQAFFGSFEDGISMEVSSAIINGNVKLNTTAHIDEDFVVVGDLNVNSNTQIKNLYVKGNLYSCTNLNVSNDTYVEKMLYANGDNHFFGNLYVEDGVDATSEVKPDGIQCGTGTGGRLLVDGNLTSNGSVYLPKHTTAYPIKVGGSLVVNGGQLVFPKIADYKTHDQSYTFKVDENVSVSGGFNDGSHLGYPAAENISFGHSGNTIYLGSTTLYQVSDDNRNSTYSHWHNHGVSTSLKSGGAPGTVYAYNASNEIFELGIRPLAANVYCDASDCAPTAYSGSEVGDGTYFRDNEDFYGKPIWVPGSWGNPGKWAYNTMRDEIFVQVNGDIATSAPTNTASWMANRMPEYEDRIETTNTGDGCGTTEHVRDPLKFNKKLLTSNLVHSKEHPLSCSSDKNFNFYDDWPADPWKQLNDCYAEAAKPENNELYDGSWLIVRLSGLAWPNGSTLRGNYIIIVDDRKSNIQSIALPSTEKTSNVILYFPEGYSAGIKTQGTGADYNYFIFSDGDISKPNGFQLAGDAITGSIYMSDCHKAYSSNVVKVKYNEDLVSALQSSAVVCANDDGDLSSGCTKSSGGPATGSGSGGSSTAEEGTVVDPFYIATAPQLGMTMVSQYKNDEIKLNRKSVFDVEPSVIVLPRIIHLNKDPSGRLSDYYTIVPLNGAKDSEISATNVSCPSEISTSGMLYDGENLLEKGVYTCNYTYENSEIPFYVVVDGVKGEKPTVTFELPENQEIDADGEATVSIKAPQGNREIKVLVSTPSLSALSSKGWSYTPQGQYTMVNDNGVNSVYRFTIPLSGSDDAIPLFVVKTEATAAQADAVFQLTDPCEGCFIGSPFMKRVFMKGEVKVQRQDLGTYCNDSEKAANFKTKFGEECSTVQERPDCGSLMQGFTWVSINGQECNVKERNEKWQCNSGLPISLYKTPLANDFCQVFVPEESLTNLEINKEYSLPATAKRKPAHLTVKLVKAGDAGSGNVTIKYKRPGASTDSYVDWTESPCRNSSCEIDFFAGDTVLLEGINGSDHFSYWTCSGRNCNEKEGVFVPSPVYKILLTGDNTLEAHFNEKDKHCTYTDFSATTAFCNSTSNDDCVDHCKNEKCSVDDPTGSAKNPNSNWLLIYKNRSGWIASDWEEPELKNNHISGPQILLGSAVGHPSVILNRIEAGSEGTLSAIFKVPSIAQNTWNQITGRPSDNGFIFRSNKNATSYFTLNVISAFEEEKHIFTTTLKYKTFARVCYADSRDANASKCKDAPFTGSLMGSDIVTTRIEKSSISLDIYGNTVVAHMSFNIAGVNFGSAYATIDLDDDVFGLNKNVLNDDDHQYIGLKFDKAGVLSSQFEVYDFAWKSEKYQDQCWDTPSVSCSFKANYAGNIVPKNQEVSPWVFMSSWFTNKVNENKCQIEYYYNGCDMPSSYYKDSRSFLGLVANDNNKNQSCVGDEPMGFYRWSANELHSYGHGLLDGEKYFFEDEGLHGKPVTGGVLKEASVIVSCDLEGSVRRYDAASCGTFNVGEMIQCSENYPALLELAETCPSDGECAVAFANRINARGASISYKITGMTEPSTIRVLVVDSQGKRSAVASEMSQSGTYTIIVSDAIATDEFNPQDVVGLVFVGTGTGGYEVSQVRSTCPNALNLICNDPVYDANSEEWYISAIVLNGDDATCQVTVVDGYNEDGIELPDPISCTSNFGQSVKQKGVYGASEDKTYKFAITALDEQGNQIAMENARCETPEVEIPVVHFTTCDLTNVVVNGGEKTIQQGKGVPSLNFEIAGCPNDRCDYTVYYDENQLVKAKGYRESGRCPNGNRCTSENTGVYYNAGSTHKYVVDAYGVKCEQEFTVSASDDNVTCSASIDVAEGMFVANLNSDDWMGTLVFSDNLGMNPTSIDVAGNSRFEYPLPNAAAGGVYQATLLVGGNECAARWNVKTDDQREPVLSMGSCENITGQNSGSSISVTPSSVIGCGDGGCNLTISPATSDGSQTGYDGSTFYFYDVNATGGTYTATVSRPGYAESSCTFTVAFEQTSTDDCHCTCPTGCDNVITSGFNPSNKTACYFTDPRNATQLNGNQWDVAVHFYNAGEKANINGVEFSRNTPACQNGSTINCLGNASTGSVRIYQWTEDQLIDGGIYFQVTEGAQSIGSEAIKFNSGTRKCNLGVGSNAGSTGGGSGSGSTSDNIKETMHVETKISTAGHYIINGCAGGNATHTSTSKNAEIQVNFKRADGNYTASAKDCENFFGSSYRSSVYGYWANGDNECSAAFKVDYPLTLDLPEGIVYTLNKCY